MKRTNEFEVVPQSDEDEELFRRLLDASAALWNEINYQRRTNFDDPDGDVWEIDEYRGRYGGTLGSSTVQQIERKNREAWRSFFALREKGEANGKPGFWGNQDEGANCGHTSETRRTRSNGANTPGSKFLLAKT